MKMVTILISLLVATSAYGAMEIPRGIEIVETEDKPIVVAYDDVSSSLDRIYMEIQAQNRRVLPN